MLELFHDKSPYTDMSLHIGAGIITVNDVDFVNVVTITKYLVTTLLINYYFIIPTIIINNTYVYLVSIVITILYAIIINRLIILLIDLDLKLISKQRKTDEKTIVATKMQSSGCI